jgi:hypothetical protein
LFYHHQQQVLVRMWGKRNTHTLMVGMQASATTLENNMEVSLKTKHRPSIWSSNPTPGDIPKGLQHSYSRGTCTPIFIAALFTIAKLWKQPRCPATDELIKKMWYLYTTEFYSALKKNEILSFSSKWMELENIILSEVIQNQKTKNRVFSLICRL